MRFDGELVSTLQVAGGIGGFDLLHKLSDLSDSVLLILRQLTAGEFLQRGVGRHQEFVGRLALLGCLLFRHSGSKFSGGIARASFANDAFLRFLSR